MLEPTDLNSDGKINIDDLQWEYLKGDGDFRSAEVTALRDEADIVITNPPFSLFREFVAWLVEADKLFAVIGTSNAVSYKEIFPLIKDNTLWKGATGNANDMVFGVPKGAEVAESDKVKAAKLGYPSDETRHYTRLGNSCWYTNIEHGRRHEEMQLMSMADHVKYSRHKGLRGLGFVHYDNYDALKIAFTDSIPGDYNGVMAVPLTFLDRYNPEQFEIVGIAKAPLGTPSKLYAKQLQVSATGVRSMVTKLNDGPALILEEPPVGKTYYEVDGKFYTQDFARILIRRKTN